MASHRQFELVRELGAGTFGTVYLADMVSLGDFRKRVALKLLNPQWDESSDAGQRLRDEARLLGRLRHRNIVAVDDLVRVDGRWGVVMEYVPGVDLEQLITETRSSGVPIPAPAALQLTAAIADALQAAFSGTGDTAALQVVHRDIKPSNVLLTREGDVKVLDFGIASANFQWREAHTNQVRFGSIPYMSPERILGEPEVSAGDIYALGCVLFELLSGSRLGRAELGPEQHERKVRTALDALAEQRGGLDDELIALIAQCLRYEVTARPGAVDVATRARALASQLPGASLEAFSRQVLPSLIERLEATHKSVEGVFSEEISPGSNPTLILPDDADPLQAPAASQREKVGLLLVGIAAAAVMLLMIAGVGGVILVKALRHSSGEASVALPAPSVAAAPAEIARTPAATAEPAAAEPATAEPAAAQPPVPVADAAPAESTAAVPAAAERIRSIKFTAPAGASAITAQCGDVSGSGTGSVNLRQAPVGTCLVSATVAGAQHQARVRVTHAAGFTCTLDGGSLACR